jgi:hypothetical protein
MGLKMNAETTTETMGLDHPLMTQERVLQLLPQGPRIPVPILQRLGGLLNPLTYQVTPAGELMALSSELSRLLEVEVRAAQAGLPSNGA